MASYGSCRKLKVVEEGLVKAEEMRQKAWRVPMSEQSKVSKEIAELGRPPAVAGASDENARSTTDKDSGTAWRGVLKARADFPRISVLIIPYNLLGMYVHGLMCSLRCRLKAVISEIVGI